MHDKFQPDLAHKSFPNTYTNRTLSPQNPLPFNTSQPLHSAHAPASAPERYQNKAQPDLFHGEDSHKSDRKLLEELHEVGIRKKT